MPHGMTWREQRSMRRRSFRSITSRCPGPGFEAGWMKVHHTVEVIDADHIESSGNNSFYRLNGQVYRTG
jgi:hypothetical protein